MQLTEQQPLLGRNMYCKQAVMPPHEFIASLYEFPTVFFPIFTGEPGRIQKYWEQNMDLFESLGIPDLEPKLLSISCFEEAFVTEKMFIVSFCLWRFFITHLLSEDTDFTIPLRIYGDGADAQQHFEIVTILPVLASGSSTLDTRILCSVRNTDKTMVETRHKILEAIRWSFEWLWS